MAVRVQYITVGPVTPKGKWQICSKRIGKDDRFRPIAEAYTEITAEKIVAALNSNLAVVLAEAAE